MWVALAMFYLYDFFLFFFWLSRKNTHKASCGIRTSQMRGAARNKGTLYEGVNKTIFLSF